MSELQKRLEKLILRVDSMGLRVEQAVADALKASREGNIEAGRQIDQNDVQIDREEVEIEQECILLLALYQPAAVDLRAICTVIKVNTDLERIADMAAGIGRRVKRMVAEGAHLADYPEWEAVAELTLDVLGKTVRILASNDVELARQVIQIDPRVNAAYKAFVRAVLEKEHGREGGAERTLTMFMLAKNMERISDHCANIAEDIIFLRTGDIVRHPDAFEAKK
jgi:phosphate transport system protein